MQKMDAKDAMLWLGVILLILAWFLKQKGVIYGF